MKEKPNKSFNNRRDFLKKNAFAALYLSSGAPLFYNEKPSLNSIETKNLDGEDYWEAIRAEFPLEKERSYFNSASLGPSSRKVIDELCQVNLEVAQKATSRRKRIDQARREFARFLAVKEDEICFSRNTTEGINLAARSLPFEEGDEILITDQEHVGGATPWLALAKEKGVKIRVVKIDLSGEGILKAFEQAKSSKTKAIFFPHVSCTTGLIFPAKQLAHWAKENGLFCCIDGAQALGMIEINLGEIQPDFYATNGHKWLFGPEGSGIIFISQKVIEQCDPVFVGAYTDEAYDLEEKQISYRMVASRQEYGTRNAATVAAMESALHFIEEIGLTKVEARGKFLLNQFRAHFDQSDQVDFLTPAQDSLYASILTLRVKNKDSKSLVDELRTAYKIKCRYIYEADLDAIRLSFSFFNTPKEVNYLIESFEAIIS